MTGNCGRVRGVQNQATSETKPGLEGTQEFKLSQSNQREPTRRETVPADQGPQSGDPTRHRALAQARESLEQGCTATGQVGLLIAQAKTASAQVRKQNWPLVRSVLAIVYRAILQLPRLIRYPLPKHPQIGLQ
jgi:hypothetical protein